MTEESVENFIARFKPYASPVEVLPRVEGSPLLECVVAGAILGLFERTSPYGARPGPAQIIINANTTGLEPAAEPGRRLSATGLSALEARGLVLERDEDVWIVDAGVPLVVSSEADVTDGGVGDWVRFTSHAPLHGFWVPQMQRVYQRREVDSDSI